MGRAQELFDQATGYYDHAVGLIRKMDELFQNAAFKNDPGRRYDPRLTLAQFDMILQATLLSMALSDGNFDRLEQQFVDKITDYGDLLTYIKQDSQGRLDLTWSQVASLREETQASLVQALPAILETLLQEGYTFVPISQLILPGTCGTDYTIDHTGRQCPACP